MNSKRNENKNEHDNDIAHHMVREAVIVLISTNEEPGSPTSLHPSHSHFLRATTLNSKLFRVSASLAVVPAAAHVGEVAWDG